LIKLRPNRMVKDVTSKVREFEAIITTAVQKQIEMLDDKYSHYLVTFQKTCINLTHQLNDAIELQKVLREQLDQRNQEIQQKDKEIEESHNLTKNQQGKIKEKEAEIKGKEAEIEKKEAKIKGKEAEIKEKEDIISKEEKMLQEKDETIAAQRLQIQEKETETKLCGLIALALGGMLIFFNVLKK
ncbi:MAG: hypothetical protein ACRDFB_05850, partial [Rhabdochlamydiaceae bacterium]